MPSVLTVNIGVPVPTEHSGYATTCIDKQPVTHAVQVTAPGPRTDGPPGASGLAGDAVTDRKHHGGDDQAVYAYAREDLDHWQGQLGRDLRNGMFGENLTTDGVVMDEVLIGEHWRIGDELVLEVSVPRIPCRTFGGFLEEKGWVRRFTQEGRTGTYFRVVTPGAVRAGDPITVLSRPDHDITVRFAFDALTLRPDLLPALAPATALPAKDREKIAKRLATR